MKFITLLIVGWVMLAATSLSAQSVSMQVISPTGGFFSNSNNRIAHTTGEMTMVQTFSSGSIVLTQGFHQPEKQNTVSINDFTPTGIASFLLYPNPVTDFCKLNFELPNAGHVSVTLLNAVGQTVLASSSQYYDSGNHTQALSLDACAAGFYVVRMQFTDNRGKTHFQNLPLQVIR
ncbi:MAG: T9SS type A sorting domain-containing protein [Chitinophagales bacterium]|nr:T9SS type A sorting domain-containing protein [Chitinophagales bacterium]